MFVSVNVEHVLCLYIFTVGCMVLIFVLCVACRFIGCTIESALYARFTINIFTISLHIDLHNTKNRITI